MESPNSRNFRVPAAAAQDAAGRCAGQPPALEFDLAVYDGVFDAVGDLVGLCETGMIDYGCGIEDRDIGEVTGFQKAAAIEVLALGGKRSDLANGGFEGQEMFVADVVAE